MNFHDQVKILCETLAAEPQSHARVVLADLIEENGKPQSAGFLRKGLCFGIGGIGDGIGDGGGDGGGIGDGIGDGGDGGYGGGDGDGGAGPIAQFKFIEGFKMTKDGLYIICSQGGYYPYVRIAWCHRGDAFIEMLNCRVIKKFGTLAELNQMAIDGPTSTTQLLKMAKLPESVSVCCASRVIQCDPAAWAKECPKPKNFDLVEVVV